ncbi:MAG: transporter substrate-binding domain-containing protein [Pseudomonadales bacterium]
MQVMFRKIILLSLIMMLSLTTGAAEKSQRYFQEVLDSGQLRIGVSIFSPWVMKAKDGQLIGSEIDMARRLAVDMGLSPEFGLYEWKKLIPALENGEIDIIVSGMGIKPKRALRVNFSRPYGDVGVGLAANTRLTADFSSLDDMKKQGVNIGVIADTVSADVAKRLFSKTTIKYFSTEDEVQQALLKGDVHAVIAASPLPKFLSLKYPEQIDVPLAKPLLNFKEGLAINKGDADFLNFLDAWVVARTADAWIPSTRHYWFETLEWQEQLPK